MKRDWRPTASLEILQLRADMLSRIRGFFAARDIMEVETPALSRAAATDPNVASFALPTAGVDRYLHTSPEFAMKRLLAAGSGNIYQICKVFRADEAGRHHNPEFTLLEWYRLGLNHLALMDEIEALLAEMLAEVRPYQRAARLTYRDAFRDYAGVDVRTAAIADYRACANKVGFEAPDDLNFQQWQDVVMSHVVIPTCATHGFAFIYDYPVEQAALACVRPGDPPAAERFELIGYGLELANGFRELTVACEQRARFEQELETRHRGGLPHVPMDESLLEALAHGLPDCAGVALGLDRLVMLAAGLDHISQAMAFSWEDA